MGQVWAGVKPAASRSLQLQEVVNEINGLGRQARDSKERFRLSSEISSLPADWRIEEENRIYYSPTGACSGGLFTIYKGREVILKQKLKPPFCQLDSEG